MILFAVDGDELVHDAAVGAHKLVFRPLAKPRQHRARIAGANSDSTASAVATSSAAELDSPDASGTSLHMLRLKPGI